MTLHKLVAPYSLITDINDLVITLANVFNVETWNIKPTHDHIYIANAYDRHSMYLTSSATRTSDDVWISPDSFYELLQDILSGMPAIEAFNKQGYTFNKQGYLFNK